MIFITYLRSIKIGIIILKVCIYESVFLNLNYCILNIIFHKNIFFRRVNIIK